VAAFRDLEAVLVGKIFAVGLDASWYSSSQTSQMRLKNSSGRM
jgi:hypothetical protein